MKIAVDFDGTCVTHEYPKVGRDIGAVSVLKKLTEAGHLLILNTMRCGKELRDAVNWFIKNGIPLYGVNKDPGQKNWTKSPKVFANVYIDDAALGCPLHYPVVDIKPNGDRIYGRPHVDWQKIDALFAKDNFYSSPDPVIGKEE